MDCVVTAEMTTRGRDGRSRQVSPHAAIARLESFHQSNEAITLLHHWAQQRTVAFRTGRVCGLHLDRSAIEAEFIVPRAPTGATWDSAHHGIGVFIPNGNCMEIAKPISFGALRRSCVETRQVKRLQGIV